MLFPLYLIFLLLQLTNAESGSVSLKPSRYIRFGSNFIPSFLIQSIGYKAPQTVHFSFNSKQGKFSALVSNIDNDHGLPEKYIKECSNDYTLDIHKDCQIPDDNKQYWLYLASRETKIEINIDYAVNTTNPWLWIGIVALLVVVIGTGIGYWVYRQRMLKRHLIDTDEPSDEDNTDEDSGASYVSPRGHFTSIKNT